MLGVIHNCQPFSKVCKTYTFFKRSPEKFTFLLHITISVLFPINRSFSNAWYGDRQSNFINILVQTTSSLICFSILIVVYSELWKFKKPMHFKFIIYFFIWTGSIAWINSLFSLFADQIFFFIYGLQANKIAALHACSTKKIFYDLTLSPLDIFYARAW